MTLGPKETVASCHEKALDKPKVVIITFWLVQLKLANITYSLYNNY